MYNSFEVNVFLITMGLLLAAMFLGLGICLGREYERIAKKYNRQINKCEHSDNCICDSGNNNNCDSNVGSIHRKEFGRQDIRISKVKEMSNEELANCFRVMKFTGISPSNLEKIFLEEGANRLEEKMEESNDSKK